MADPPRQRKRALWFWSAGWAAAKASKVWRTVRQNSVSFQSAGGMVTATIGSGATISAKAGRKATPSTVLSKRSARSLADSRADGICSLWSMGRRMLFMASSCSCDGRKFLWWSAQHSIGKAEGGRRIHVAGGVRSGSARTPSQKACSTRQGWSCHSQRATGHWRSRLRSTSRRLSARSARRLRHG